MIIVSQDEKKIVNFDNIAHIFISKDSENHYLIEYGKMNGSSELLGIYATEERAEEVLRDIIDEYSCYRLDVNNSANYLPKICEMPKE